jgi:hypothetical protein
MSKTFNTQDYLRISATYTANISSDIDSVKIKYRKPDGTTGEWNATHDSANKKIYYDLPAETVLDAGMWTAWSFATMTDGRDLPGEPFQFKITEEGR